MNGPAFVAGVPTRVRFGRLSANFSEISLIDCYYDCRATSRIRQGAGEVAIARDPLNGRDSLKTCKGRRELLVRWTARPPRRHEAVTRPPRDEMNMEVEDVLPPRRPVRLSQVESVGSELPLQELCDALRHHQDGGKLLLRDIPDVGGVDTRNNEGVAFGSLPAIEKCKCPVILSHDVRGRIAGDDPTKDAVGHESSIAGDFQKHRFRALLKSFGAGLDRRLLRTVTRMFGNQGHSP